MKYFTKKEFDSPDLKGSGDKMDLNFLIKLNAARGIAGIPFVINSGYRTKEHNKKVGGKTDSSHLIGKAADIKVENSNERWIILAACISAGFDRIGIGQGFIHVDNDTSKSPEVAWLY